MASNKIAGIRGVSISALRIFQFVSPCWRLMDRRMARHVGQPQVPKASSSAILSALMVDGEGVCPKALRLASRWARCSVSVIFRLVVFALGSMACRPFWVRLPRMSIPSQGPVHDRRVPANLTVIDYILTGKRESRMEGRVNEGRCGGMVRGRSDGRRYSMPTRR